MKRAVSASSVGITKSQPVQYGAVGLAAGEAQHPRAQRPEQDRRAFGNGSRELEAVHLEGLEDLIDLLSVERALHEAQHVTGAGVGLVVLHAVPALYDRLTRGTESHREASAGRLGERGDAHRHQPRPSSEDRGDRHPQVEALLPSGGEHERCEPVGAVDFGGPDVGVAQVGQAMEPLFVLGERDAVEGDSDAVARSHCLSVPDAPT
jgi:hypothetical protein